MAVTSIQVYPTCDIHLLLDQPVTPYQLEVRDADPAADDNVTDSDRTEYSGFQSVIARVSRTGLITPSAVGETFCRIRHTDTDDGEEVVSEIVIRIRVHQRIDKLWFGNNRATVVEDQDNYVLSVYAKFEDGTIGDVSGHPYLTFFSTDTSRVRVGSNLDSEPDPGRLLGFGPTGETPVTVRVRVGALSDEVPVFVEPAFSTTPRPFLERLHGAGPITDRRYILILSEGFAEQDRDLFRRLVVLLKDELFGSKLHSPYDLLKDRFNVWTVFDPSPEEGATCGEWIDFVPSGPTHARPLSKIRPKRKRKSSYTLLQLIRRVGLPDRYRPLPADKPAALAAWAPWVAATNFDEDKVEDAVFETWRNLVDYRLLQARDSRFGLMHGARYGDRSSVRVNPTDTPTPLIDWYDPPAQSHGLERDRRRMDRSWTRRASTQEYLGGLRLRGGSAANVTVWADPDSDVAVDRSLIVFLTNSAIDGAAWQQGFGLGLSTRQNRVFTETQITGDETDHRLPPLEVLSSLPALAGSSLNETVSTLAHELGHAFHLGDEYEGQSYGTSHHILDATNLTARRSVQDDQNLTHYFVIQAAPGGHRIIDVTGLKWRRWHRVARCSELTADPVPLGGGRLRIRFARKDRTKWERADMHNIEVFLRSRSINADRALPPDPRRGLIISNPLKILQFDPDGSCILASTDSDEFEQGDVLYLPQLQNGDPLTVFHPDVLAGLETSGQPFALKTGNGINKANTGASYPPEVLTRGFSPRHPAYVVGVYDGGGTYNSRVYRAAGMCKMRSQDYEKVTEIRATVDAGLDEVLEEVPIKKIMPFCYVCGYGLVNAIHPARLADLAYPT
jgi:hypothetical protein